MLMGFFFSALVNQDPCMNGGVYALAHQDYICICPKEFRGKNCQGWLFQTISNGHPVCLSFS